MSEGSFLLTLSAFLCGVRVSRLGLMSGFGVLWDQPPAPPGVSPRNKYPIPLPLSPPNSPLVLPTVPFGVDVRGMPAADILCEALMPRGPASRWGTQLCLRAGAPQGGSRGGVFTNRTLQPRLASRGRPPAIPRPCPTLLVYSPLTSVVSPPEPLGEVSGAKETPRGNPSRYPGSQN